MAFFSPGFMLGAATRATERIDDARERNEELAEEIQKLTKEHSKIASKAISARAVQDSQLISEAKRVLSASGEGQAILKNVKDSDQTLIAIGREAAKRMAAEPNLSPELFNKALFSKSFTADNKFQNPYNLVQANLDTNPSEEAKQTEKLGFGQRLLEGLVGKKPTVEGAVADMSPEMREAVLRSIRSGQPLAARDPIEFAAGDIKVPVFSPKELEQQRLQKEEQLRREDKAEKDLQTRIKLEDKRRDQDKAHQKEMLRLRDSIQGKRKHNFTQFSQRLNESMGLEPELSPDKATTIRRMANYLYERNYYTNERVHKETVLSAPLKLIGAGITELNEDLVKELFEKYDGNVDAFVETYKRKAAASLATPPGEGAVAAAAAETQYQEAKTSPAAEGEASVDPRTDTEVGEDPDLPPEALEPPAAKVLREQIKEIEDSIKERQKTDPRFNPPALQLQLDKLYEKLSEILNRQVEREEKPKARTTKKPASSNRPPRGQGSTDFMGQVQDERAARGRT